MYKTLKNSWALFKSSKLPSFTFEISSPVAGLYIGESLFEFPEYLIPSTKCSTVFIALE